MKQTEGAGKPMWRTPPPRLETSRHQRHAASLLIPLAFSLFWIAAAVAVFGVHGSGVFALAGVGLALTVALLALLQRQHARLRGLEATDALTDLANQR
jgi:hypothetical protein